MLPEQSCSVYQNHPHGLGVSNLTMDIKNKFGGRVGDSGAFCDMFYL